MIMLKLRGENTPESWGNRYPNPEVSTAAAPKNMDGWKTSCLLRFGRFSGANLSDKFKTIQMIWCANLKELHENRLDLLASATSPKPPRFGTPKSLGGPFGSVRFVGEFSR